MEALEKFDAITTKRLDLNYSYYEGFGENHNILSKELERISRRVVLKLSVYERLCMKSHTLDMMIAKEPV